MSNARNDMIYDDILEVMPDLDPDQQRQVEEAIEDDFDNALYLARWFADRNAKEGLRILVKVNQPADNEANAKGKDKTKRQTVQPLDKDA